MNLIQELGLVLLITLIITSVWQLYEIFMFGEIKPDVFDTIITIVLAVSLTTNIIAIKIIKEIR